MNQLFNEFLLLEREVASGGQTMESDLSKKVAAYLSVVYFVNILAHMVAIFEMWQVADLKESWLRLSASVRRVTNPLVLSSNSTNNGNQSSPVRRILTSPDTNQNQVTLRIKLIVFMFDQVVSAGVVGNSPSSPSVPSSGMECLPSSGTQGNHSSASMGNPLSGISSSHELRPSSPTSPSLTEEVILEMKLYLR